ncbi:MAG: hypothetical protein AAFZ92_01080 [Pseudomonadota bacterium]
MTAHVVDAHHHLWRYTPETHAWIDPGSMGAIARDFSAADLEAEAAAVGVDAAVAVQAEQTLEETHALLAAQNPDQLKTLLADDVSTEGQAKDLAAILFVILPNNKDFVGDVVDSLDRRRAGDVFQFFYDQDGLSNDDRDDVDEMVVEYMLQEDVTPEDAAKLLDNLDKKDAKRIWQLMDEYMYPGKSANEETDKKINEIKSESIWSKIF